MMDMSKKNEILNRTTLIQNFRILECGRSMVEMLGVLAIMGILSIVGIKGYHNAINSFSTNNILYELNKRAHSCIAQINMMDHACSLAEYGDNLDGYSTSLLSFPKNQYFGIKLTGIPKEICTKIQTTVFPIASKILPKTCSSTNEMIFIFDRNLSSGTDEIPLSCSETKECGECERCGENGFCENTCHEGQTCAKDFENPNASKSCCSETNLVDGVCCANPDGNGNCCDSNGKNCCPPDTPIMTIDGVCHTCDDYSSNQVKNSTEDYSVTCNRCPNRHINLATSNKKYCVLTSCPKETPVQSYDGFCYPCSSSSYIRISDYGIGYNNSCSLCSNRGEWGFLNGHSMNCGICPEGAFVDSNGKCACPPEKPLLGQRGCYACDENVDILSLPDPDHWCESVCSNRKTFSYCCGYLYCGLKECSDNQFHDWRGVCYDCDTPDRVSMRISSIGTITPYCSECNGSRYMDGEYCKKCPPDISGLTQAQQAECTPT